MWPWFWERLKAGGEGDNWGWDGWMASLTQWTWVWVSSGSCWWTGKPGVLQSMGSQRVRDNWATEQQQRQEQADGNIQRKIPLGCAEPNTGRKGKRGGICIRFYKYQEEMLETYEAFLLLKQNETVGRLLKADWWRQPVNAFPLPALRCWEPTQRFYGKEKSLFIFNFSGPTQWNLSLF